MANYTASALLAAQAKFSKDFNAPELRRKQNPALMMALKNTEVTIPSHKELRKKDNRPVKAYIKTKRAAGSGTAKAHNHTGGKADSAEVTLAWVRFVEPFSINLKQGQSNMFNYQDMLAHEMMQSAQNLHDRAGTAALAYLQSNRCQLSAPQTGGAGTWNNTNYAFEVDAAKEKFFFQHIRSFMGQQNYRGQFDVLADSTMYRLSETLSEQGPGNNTNTSFQFRDLNISETTEVIDANYSNGSALIMPAGSFAGLVWNDPVNLKGKGDYDSYNGGYGIVDDPLGTGTMFDFHAYTQRSDGSSTGGGVQDETLEAEMSLCIAWALPPLTTANETVVYEAAQMA